VDHPYKCLSVMVIRVMEFPVEDADSDPMPLASNAICDGGLGIFSGVPRPCPIDRHRPVPDGHERTVHTELTCIFVGSTCPQLPYHDSSISHT
jgi:hypothetical protein